MKYLSNLRKSLFFLGLLIPICSFTQDYDNDLKARADELFRESNYYDAFYLYRRVFGSVVSENEAALKCSHAMALTKQFKDYQAIGNLPEARHRLQDLLVINPEDINKPALVKMDLDEAHHLQEMAFRQETAQESNNMLDRAIELYKQTLKLGWKSEDVDDSIRECELAKMDKENYIRTYQKEVKENKSTDTTQKVPIVIFLKNNN